MSPLPIAPTTSSPIASSQRREPTGNQFSNARASHVRFGAANTPETPKLGFLGTIRAIYKQLQVEDPSTRQVFKGLALKHGPDLALPAFFAIPVVGWVAGLIAMPFIGLLEGKGQKIIDEQHAQMRTDNKNHPLRHYIKLQKLWDGNDSRPADKQSKRGPNVLKDKASRFARAWNRLIKALFNHEDAEVNPTALRHKLSFSLDEHHNPNGSMFTRLKRLMDVREHLQQKWYYKVFLKPLDWLYKKLPLPKVIKAIGLLPKLLIVGMLYWMGVKPK